MRTTHEAGVQGKINASDGDHKIDVAEHEVPLIRHMIRYDPEVDRNGCRVTQGRSMDDVRNILDGNQKGIVS
jgi:hypothetical protein